MFSILILTGLSSLGAIYAQNKTIVINKELEENSDKFKVKKGTQWMGKISKIKFGDYKVADSKNGWVKTKVKSNFWNTFSESKTENKFSFVMEHESLGSSIVNTLSQMTVKEARSFKLLSIGDFEFYTGPDDDYTSTKIFSSEIQIKDDTGEPWSMHLAMTNDHDAGYSDEGILSCSDRLIFIEPISSNKNGNDSRKIPARGYEFIEDNKSLGAVQYYGGGVFGLNKSFVWIRSELKPKMKLVLASAMIIILQIKPDQFSDLFSEE
ncbi:hypothetical protein [Seonamhaeicola aphaedonensis]|uniref:hypothetical protein n=1 Tax=Seonamhaeicola aphaedonensis TaxID=1461338 RepID=UPI0011C059BE|nr:hypothetical protein [Seonamhaeicola aphaedonensis]